MLHFDKVVVIEDKFFVGLMVFLDNSWLQISITEEFQVDWAIRAKLIANKFEVDSLGLDRRKLDFPGWRSTFFMAFPLELSRSLITSSWTGAACFWRSESCSLQVTGFGTGSKGKKSRESLAGKVSECGV